jgi:hypothetical protein
MEKITKIQNEYGLFKKGKWQSTGGTWYGVVWKNDTTGLMEFLSREEWERFTSTDIPQLDPLPF